MRTIPRRIVPKQTFRPSAKSREYTFSVLLELAVCKSQEQQQLACRKIEFARVPDYVYCMHDETSTPLTSVFCGPGDITAISDSIIRRAERCKSSGFECGYGKFSRGQL